MKTRLELTEEIEALQTELDAMPDMGTNYKPKMGEDYYYYY